MNDFYISLIEKERKPATVEELDSCKMVIYGIYNTIGKKWYIGQTIHTFRRRYYRHDWVKYATNDYIKQEAEKYGMQAFEIFLLEREVASKDILDDLEKSYIKECDSIYPNGYNFESGGQRYNKKVNKRSKEKLSTYLLKKHAKERILYDKDENRVVFYNLVTFAKENNLDARVVSSLLQGKRLRSYRGWHLEGMNINGPHRTPKTHTIAGPDGTIYQFNNPAQFAKEHGLDSHIYNVLNGSSRYHNGYHLPDSEERGEDFNWRSAYNNTRKYEKIVLEKDGQEYAITDKKSMEEFLENNEIAKREIYTLTSGKQKTSRGFRLVSTIPYKQKND